MEYRNPRAMGLILAAMFFTGCAVSPPHAPLESDHPANPSATEATEMAPSLTIQSYKAPSAFSKAKLSIDAPSMTGTGSMHSMHHEATVDHGS